MIRVSLLIFKKNNGGNTATKYNTNKKYTQVDSDEISYHIVSINPTNHAFLDPTSQLGRYLGSLKFYVKIFENTPTVWFDSIIRTLKMIAQY